jgi:hypothetical protein
MTMTTEVSEAVASNAELGAVAAAQKPTALLHWSLDVDCPKCAQSNDLATGGHDAEYNIARPIFNNEWDKLKGWEVICQHCGHEFEIDGVEY